MNIDQFIKKERVIWHNHFAPSLIAAIAVAAISIIMRFTISNIILFASVGASAVILTNSKSHRLTSLRVTIIAYLIAIILSTLIRELNMFYPLPLPVSLFLVTFMVGIGLYLGNAPHPPALSASLSFLLLSRPFAELLYLFISIILLMVFIRLAAYIFSQNLTVKEFSKEFKKAKDMPQQELKV